MRAPAAYLHGRVTLPEFLASFTTSDLENTVLHLSTSTEGATDRQVRALVLLWLIVLEFELSRRERMLISEWAVQP